MYGKPSQGLAAIRYGLFITTIGGLLFTLDLPLLRLAAADKWTMVFARGLMLFMALTASWYVARRYFGSTTPFINGRAGLAVVGTSTIANISYIGAVVEAHAANVVFILALVPILTAIFSRVFIKEQVHAYTWIAAAVAFLGAGLIVIDGIQSGRFLGDVLAFTCACCMAAAFTITRASGKHIATSLGLGSLAAAVLAFVVFGVDFGSLWQSGNFGIPALWFLAVNGLLIMPLASTLIAHGPRYLPSVDVSMFFLLETVLTPVWIWMLFGEAPTRSVMIGGAVVATALLVHSLWRLLRGIKPDAPIYHD